jgi:hypothetical protein
VLPPALVSDGHRCARLAEPSYGSGRAPERASEEAQVEDRCGQADSGSLSVNQAALLDPRPANSLLSPPALCPSTEPADRGGVTELAVGYKRCHPNGSHGRRPEWPSLLPMGPFPALPECGRKGQSRVWMGVVPARTEPQVRREPRVPAHGRLPGPARLRRGGHPNPSPRSGAAGSARDGCLSDRRTCAGAGAHIPRTPGKCRVPAEVDLPRVEVRSARRVLVERNPKGELERCDYASRFRWCWWP